MQVKFWLLALFLALVACAPPPAVGPQGSSAPIDFGEESDGDGY